MQLMSHLLISFYLLKQMPGGKFMVFLCITFVVIIIGLLIEFSYNKSHASLVVLAPERILVINAKELNAKNDIVIYNSSNVKLEQALRKIPKDKRSKYIELPIEPHLSKRITKPFNDSYKEMKEGYGETMPVSYVLKTAAGISDIAHNLTSANGGGSPYKMLKANTEKFTAFMDEHNIYIK